jgi:hypothetical protein
MYIVLLSRLYCNVCCVMLLDTPTNRYDSVYMQHYIHHTLSISHAPNCTPPRRVSSCRLLITSGSHAGTVHGGVRDSS